MPDVAFLQNGTVTVPQKRTSSGRVVPDASLREIHREKQKLVGHQIEVGVRSEAMGYDRMFFTEHHFQPTGSEFSTNPLMSQMAVASRTESIRLGQLANILTWHDPVRFAEQSAILDLTSDGRADIGVGRGYQPRENEVLGQYWGGTIQDQEKNRRVFREKLDIIRRCWTQDLVQYRGEYHSIPPSHTKWHHKLDYEYFNDPVTEQSVEDVMDWNEDGDFYSDLWSDVMSGGTTLKQIAVFPQPQQDPHPPLWMPVVSRRSVQFAARNGINGACLFFPEEHLSDLIDLYMNTAAEAGWPDHRPQYDGVPFKRGWDSERQRGVLAGRVIWNPFCADAETNEQWELGQENSWNFYQPLISISPLFSDPDAASEWITAEMIKEEPFNLVGDDETIREGILRMMDRVGYEDLGLLAYFDTPGITLEDECRQMRRFQEKVVPHLP